MDQLEARSAAILRTIIREHISTGEPVGSRSISKKEEIGLSPASIRNIMSDLKELGYISQPHVSAGRVPTDRGYRFYVDKIGTEGWLNPGESKVTIESWFGESSMDIRDVLRRSSSVLAGLSRQAGVVTSSAPREQRFKTIDFIKVSEDRIVVVLVSCSGFVQNKMIYDEDDINQENLERYSRMLNDVLKDLDLRQAKEKIETELAKEKTRMDRILAKIMKISYLVLSQEDSREVFIEGQANFLDEPEFAGTDQLKALLITLEEKSRILRILDKTLEAGGIQIFIGAEHGLDELDACSIVAYPIRNDDSGLASISVIGPKRMNYRAVVPLVITTGEVVTRIAKKIVESTI
ncbi:heat-inducible transcriptional repressor HrcA [Thermodesulfobacteriota bacterium]